MAWRDHALELVDQRVLPLRFETVRCADAFETAAAIRAMVVRGAPAIGCAAAFGIAAEAWKSREFEPAAFEAALVRARNVLAASRPTAVNLRWALERLTRAVQGWLDLAPSAIASRIEAEAVRMFEEDIAVNRAMGAAGAALIPQDARIMTHCNTGALATAGHGTALGVIRSARDLGRNPIVVANETRPFLQGARLTVWELQQDNIPTTLITDNMAGHFMKAGRIGCVVVGADRIAANGDVANKVGTYSVAVLAKENGVPFYVAAPVSTFDLSIESGDQIPIEQRPASEVTHVFGVPIAPENIEVQNPAFDVTPSRYVTAIICEHGVARAPYKQSLAALASKTSRATVNKCGN